MSVWDKALLHRALINRELHGASDELHRQIDAYRQEYEAAVKRCDEEIDAEKVKKDQQYAQLRQEYAETLARNGDEWNELSERLIAYAEEYLREQLIYATQKKKKIERWQLHEYRTFLKDQRGLLEDEIKLLEERKNILGQRVNISDVTALLRVTGAELSCDDCRDAQTLYKRVGALLSQSDALPPQTRAALLRLRRLLQERTEYLPIYQYTSWLVEQKKARRRELRERQREANVEWEASKRELEELDEARQRQHEVAAEIAERVWSILTESLVDAALELTDVQDALDRKYNSLECVKEEINAMKEARADDSVRWENLWDAKRSLGEEIGQLKEQRDRCYRHKKELNAQRKDIFDLLKRHGVRLISLTDRNEGEVVRALRRRQEALEERWEDKKRGWEEDEKREKELFDRKLANYAREIEKKEREAAAKNEWKARLDRQVEEKQRKDTRLFFKQFFSDTEEVAQAKRRRDEAMRECRKLAGELDDLKKQKASCKADQEAEREKRERLHALERQAAEREIDRVKRTIERERKRKTEGGNGGGKW